MYEANIAPISNCIGVVVGTGREPVLEFELSEGPSPMVGSSSSGTCGASAAPVRSSRKMTPKLNMSTFSLYGWWFAASGAMYKLLPSSEIEPFSYLNDKAVKRKI